VDFDFSDDEKQLGREARRFLGDRSSSAVVRGVLEGAEPYDKALWQGLGEMGFLGAAIPEAYGGLGAGYLSLCVIAEELGRALAPVPVSSSIYLAAEFLLAAGSHEQKAVWLPRLASGEVVGTFAFAETAGRVTPRTINAQVIGGKLTGTKVPVPDGDAADFAIVAARTGAGSGEGAIGLFLVDLTGPGVSRAAVSNLDPTRSQAKITFDGAPAELLSDGGWRTISDVLDRAAVLVAFEQVGGADRALEMGRDYALERMAFGRQIGSFQAIKHMLADMYVAATLARSNAYYAAWALSTGSSELPQAAATARISATQAFQHCAKNNIQVHGGMGFTWAFDCHLFYRRANALAVGLGGQSMWEDLLIERLRGRNDVAA
jgi:acyl-CoA dehydrogenase